MTQEEKAKAYDEVRKKIAIRFGSNVADEIFSQFEMSEDERIRKWLINLVKGHIEWLEDRIREQLSNGQVYGDELVKAKNSLAWLEKQGEQKPFDYENANIQQKDFEPKSAMEAIKGKNTDNANKVEPNDYSRIDPYFFKPVDKVEPKFKIGDKIKLAREPKYPAREIVAIQDDAYYFDEVVHLPFSRQDEWELVEKNHVEMKTPEESLGIDSDTYNKIVDECIYGEQKPIIDNKDAEKAAEEYKNFRISCGIKDPVMLNEIEEAYYEGAIRKQKTVEWSEEDENNIINICAHLRDILTDDALKKYRNWFKSLRPQSTWKPSEEQFNNTSCTHLSKEEAESKVWKQ